MVHDWRNGLYRWLVRNESQACGSLASWMIIFRYSSALRDAFLNSSQPITEMSCLVQTHFRMGRQGKDSYTSCFSLWIASRNIFRFRKAHRVRTDHTPGPSIVQMNIFFLELFSDALRAFQKYRKLLE